MTRCKLGEEADAANAEDGRKKADAADTEDGHKEADAAATDGQCILLEDGAGAGIGAGAEAEGCRAEVVDTEDQRKLSG